MKANVLALAIVSFILSGFLLGFGVHNLLVGGKMDQTLFPVLGAIGSFLAALNLLFTMRRREKLNQLLFRQPAKA